LIIADILLPYIGLPSSTYFYTVYTYAHLAIALLNLRSYLTPLVAGHHLLHGKNL